MLKSIWKYPLELIHQQTINVPVDARPVCVQMQNGQLMLWADVSPDAIAAPFEVMIMGTGGEREENPDFHYLGTVQDRVYIWHVFTQAKPL